MPGTIGDFLIQRLQSAALYSLESSATRVLNTIRMMIDRISSRTPKSIFPTTIVQHPISIGGPVGDPPGPRYCPPGNVSLREPPIVPTSIGNFFTPPKISLTIDFFLNGSAQDRAQVSGDLPRYA